MTPRKLDLRQRKEQILAITVDQYIETVTPVSSVFIASQYGIDLSPATIRHVLAELEEGGYLTHPHTSAGRVPTQKGYRYYVDNLMEEIQLLEEEKARIRAEYDLESAVLDKLLERTSKVLSETTHCASLVSIDGWGGRLLCRGMSFMLEYPDYQDVSKIRGILAALDEKERLLGFINKKLQEKTAVFIGKELECEDIDTCSLAVACYQSRHGYSGRIAVLGPTCMNYKRVVSVLGYFSDLIENML